MTIIGTDITSPRRGITTGEQIVRIFYTPALLAKNPDCCRACGYIGDYRYFFELEPGGRFQSGWKTTCTKTRGWCQFYNCYIGNEDQEIITVKVTDVVTGQKRTETAIV